MGMATKRLGLGSTRSTTYYEPFDVARTFATIDLMTNGRAAWNVVTSMNDGEALNMGSDLHMEHDRRYERAEEFMQVVMGHWKSWDDDAIMQDRETGRFADPDKVRRIDHTGEFFKSRGPFTVPRSKQGHPVIIQAGQSGPGKRFAARWGELLFVGSPVSLDLGRQNYKQIKEAVAAQGRDPSHCVIAPSAYIVSAETKMEAEDKMAFIETLATDEDALSLLSESMNFDFSTKALDEPFTDDELANISGTQSQRDRTVQLSGSKNPTPADFIKHTRRARPNKPFVGGPKEVADGLEEWFATGICDGFVVAATHVPGTYVEFVKYVIPELQRRGLYHKDYKGETLRENLGLPIPRVGC
jgi:FMN-dependent oxidoreductase (nitrilotriacetate monooxygenase family)